MMRMDEINKIRKAYFILRGVEFLRFIERRCAFVLCGIFSSGCSANFKKILVAQVG